MATSQDTVPCDLLRQNLMCRFSWTTDLSMEKFHHHILQFMHGTGCLWRQSSDENTVAKLYTW